MRLVFVKSVQLHVTMTFVLRLEGCIVPPRRSVAWLATVLRVFFGAHVEHQVVFKVDNTDVAIDERNLCGLLYLLRRDDHFESTIFIIECWRCVRLLENPLWCLWATRTRRDVLVNLVEWTIKQY